MKKYINLSSMLIFLLVLIYLIIVFPSYSLAAPIVSLSSNKDIVSMDEEFEISINLNDISAVAVTLTIGYDNSKFEYLGGPESSNEVDSTVIFNWYDQTGGRSQIKEIDIASFKFKAKVDSDISLFHISGELYGSDLNQIATEFKSKEIQIGEPNQHIDMLINDFNNVKSQNISNDFGFLKILRLDKEGITPNFEHDVYEYFIVVDSNVDNIDITAIPANDKDKIIISGNTALKNGINAIKINVEAEDSKVKRAYTINVTKTSDIQSTNVSLETLAIENATLSPEYSNDITKYGISVSNDTENLNILAIPEVSSTKVSITGDKDLKEGNNTIIVSVVGKDNITQRNITIIAHKNTVEEDKQEKQKIVNNIEQTKALIDSGELNIISSESEGLEQNIKDKTLGDKENKTPRVTLIIFITVIVILAITAFIIYIKRFKSDKENKEKDKKKD